jgi:hypothetical protein
MRRRRCEARAGRKAVISGVAVGGESTAGRRFVTADRRRLTEPVAPTATPTPTPTPTPTSTSTSTSTSTPPEAHT